MLKSYLRYAPSPQEITEFINSFLRGKLNKGEFEDTENRVFLSEPDLFKIIKFSVRFMELNEIQYLKRIFLLLQEAKTKTELDPLLHCIKTYVQATIAYSENKFHQSISIIKNAKKHECTNTPAELIQEFDFLLINNLLRLRDTATSLPIATKALEDISNDIVWRRVYAFSRLANAFYLSGNYTIAKKIFYQALQNLTYPDNQLEFIIHNNLGVCNYQLGNLELAEKHLLRALAIIKEQQTINNHAIGLIYQNLGEICLFNNELRRAEDYFQQSIFYLKQNDPPFYMFLSDSLVMLIQVYAISHRYEKIQVLFDELKEISKTRDVLPLTNNLVIAKILFEISRGNLYDAYQAYDQIESLNQNKQPLNVLAWRIRLFLSVLLFSFTRDKKYLIDAKKNVNIVTSTNILKENTLFNVQQEYLKLLIEMYEGKTISDDRIMNLIESLEKLPGKIKERYTLLFKSLRLGGTFTIPLTITDLFQVSFPSTIYSKTQEVKPFKEIISEIALYKVSDLGPEIVYATGKIMDTYVIERLGTFSIILIGTGNRYPEGFWGPLPTSQPEYNAFILSRIVNDSKSMDPRRKGWVFSVLNFYIKSNSILSEKEQDLLRSKGIRLYEQIHDISELTREEWLQWVTEEFPFLNEYTYES